MLIVKIFKINDVLERNKYGSVVLSPISFLSFA